jgi:hypothetical protein
MEFVFFTLFHTFETERSDLTKKSTSAKKLCLYAQYTRYVFFSFWW